MDEHCGKTRRKASQERTGNVPGTYQERTIESQCGPMAHSLCEGARRNNSVDEHCGAERDSPIKNVLRT